MQEAFGARCVSFEALPEHDSQVSDHFERWSSPSEFFGADTVAISHLTIRPGESGPMHAHGAPVEEFYVLLEGNVDIDVLDPESGEVETFELTEGHIAYFPSGVYKQPVNRYDETAVQLRFGSVSEEGESNSTVAEGY